MDNNVFEHVSTQLKPHYKSILDDLFGGDAKLKGQEYMVASPRGGKGESMRFNLEKGVGQEFNGGKSFDIISLYAENKSIKNYEAAKELAQKFNINFDRIREPKNQKQPVPPRTSEKPTQPIPPSIARKAISKQSWIYRNLKGDAICIVQRQDKEDGKKDFWPRIWSPTENKLISKAPKPRPIYGLEKLKNKKPIIIVEGEKTADAAQKLTDKYSVISWMGGASAVYSVDWSPVKNRSVFVVPDQDDPGIRAATKIAKILTDNDCRLSIVDLSTLELPNGWDLADAEPDTDLDAVIAEYSRFYEAQSKSPAPLPKRSRSEIWAELDLDLSKSNYPYATLHNISLILENDRDWKGCLWYDEFHEDVFIKWMNKKPSKFENGDELTLACILQSKYGIMGASDAMAFKALMKTAKKNRKNEPLDYLQSLKWDQIPRLIEFFPKYFGTTTSDYTQRAGANFWISMAARVASPGSKVDNMVILEGKQGAMKSSALEVIGGDWFISVNESVQSKDFYINLRGALIVEIEELDAFHKSEQTAIKRAVTSRKDRYRSPYERTYSDHPRRCVFVGTTNEDDYLKDPTGGRRYWPIEVGPIDINALRQDRDQLFAEAYHRYKKGESWWEMPDSAMDVQESKRHQDEWQEIIENWIAKFNITQCTTKDFLITQMGFKLSDIDLRTQRRVTSIFRVLGFRNRAVKINGTVKKRWVKHDAIN